MGETQKQKRPYFETSEDESGDLVSTVYLTRKYEAHGEPFDELHLHEPELGELRVVDKAEGRIEAVGKIIATIAGKPFSTVQKFKYRDFLACSEALASLGFTPAQLGSEEEEGQELEI